MDLDKTFGEFANRTARMTGTPWAFGTCVLVVLAWAVSGPVFGFSETWQLVINTGTTIVTFLMVFLIQNTQNRDGAAIQAKLDELILTSKAENDYIGIEKLTDRELQLLRDQCAERAKRHTDLQSRLNDAMAERTKGGSAAGAEPAPESQAKKPAERAPSTARKRASAR